jgi:hypothetical protein
VERRVFVSVNTDLTLDQPRRELKRAVLTRLIGAGYSPQIPFECGLPSSKSWMFDQINSVMRRCTGALVLGFPRWRATPLAEKPILLVGEYSHYEGAVALAYGLPTLIAAEEDVARRGIVDQGGGRAIAPIPGNATSETLFSGEFGRAFDAWLDEMKDRRDVFLGYCSRSQAIANAIQTSVRAAGASVHDWAMDFRAGASILDEIEAARVRCGRGIFVFSEDDPLEGPAGQAAPRDNVVFEAGVFIGTKGARNCLIVRVGNAKMPADLGGTIYVSLAAGGDVSTIDEQVRQFVEASIQ